MPNLDPHADTLAALLDAALAAVGNAEDDDHAQEALAAIEHVAGDDKKLARLGELLAEE